MTTTLKQNTYESIFADIIRGVYDVSSIITERAMIEKYGVSKSPVREALIELCNDNVLQSVPRMGYRVLPLSPQEMTDALSARVVIELAALEITLESFNNDMLHALNEQIKKGHDIMGNQDAFLHWDTNSKFHLTLCSFSGNQYLTQMLDSLLKVCSRGATHYFFQSWKNKLDRDNMDRHLALMTALERGDKHYAREILRKDIIDFKSDFSY